MQGYKPDLSRLKEREHFLPKKLEEMKLNNGVRIQIYPKLSPNALVAEHSHALQANKHTVTVNPRIPFKKGFSFVALRPGRLHLSYVFLYPPPSGSKIAHPLDQFYFWNVVTLS